MCLAGYSPVCTSQHDICLFWNSMILLTYGNLSANHKAKFSMFIFTRPWNSQETIIFQKLFPHIQFKVEPAKFHMIILDTNKEPAWTSSTEPPGLSGSFHSRELGKIPGSSSGKRAVPDPRRPWPPHSRFVLLLGGLDTPRKLKKNTSVDNGYKI